MGVVTYIVSMRSKDDHSWYFLAVHFHLGQDPTLSEMSLLKLYSPLLTSDSDLESL